MSLIPIRARSRGGGPHHGSAEPPDPSSADSQDALGGGVTKEDDTAEDPCWGTNPGTEVLDDEDAGTEEPEGRAERGIRTAEGGKEGIVEIATGHN